jgi:hypothetical protein
MVAVKKLRVIFAAVLGLALAALVMVSSCAQSGGGGGGGGGNIIRLYYTYSTTTDKGDNRKNFGSAYSADGLHFTAEAGARLSYEAAGEYLTDPDFFKESSSQWTLFYSKAISPVAGETYTLYKATASNAKGTFTIDPAFVDGYGNISSTLKVGNEFYCYCASNGAVAVSRYDTAANALIFLRVVVDRGWDPSVIKISNTSFVLFYKDQGDIYQADSIDGITWTNNTLLVADAEVPGAVYVGGIIYLYYIDATSGSETEGKILLRTRSDLGATFGDAQEIQGIPEETACDPDPVVYE